MELNSLPISAKEQGITINQFKSNKVFLVANAVSNPDLLLYIYIYIYILFSVFVLVKVLVCIIGFSNIVLKRPLENQFCADRRATVFK
jgi:hypothetical protein